MVNPETMSKKSISQSHFKRLEYLSIFLRELRINEGLTQQELSQQMNIHRNTIIRAEKAENLTLISIFELVDALDISLKELFQDIE
jgi:transcriptional regulator with XRE-family HTH domain